MRIVGQPAGEGKSAAVVVGAVTGLRARLSSEGVFKKSERAQKLMQVL